MRSIEGILARHGCIMADNFTFSCFIGCGGNHGDALHPEPHWLVGWIDPRPFIRPSLDLEQRTEVKVGLGFALKDQSLERAMGIELISDR